MHYRPFKILEKFTQGKIIEIQSYLEIGVREGHSMKYVLDTWNIQELVLCDTWGSEYGGSGRGNCRHIQEILCNYFIDNVTILSGDSRFRIPEYFSNNPTAHFNLAFIDGDHSGDGLWQDLQNLYQHADIIAVDDIRHPQHLYIKEVIRGFYESIQDFLLLDNGGNLNFLIHKTIL